VALKTILKEIDPQAFEQAMDTNQAKKKELRVEQDPEERKKMDEKWAQVYAEVKKKHPEFEEPDSKFALIKSN
jgi:hypothetical protein